VGERRRRSPTVIPSAIQAPDRPVDGLAVGYAAPPDYAFAGALDALYRALPPGAGPAGAGPGEE
jgi:hypothetical protein